MSKIAALFVETGGIYFNDDRIDPWDRERNAFLFRGPGPVIAHPPCERWGRYWGGGPMLHGTPKQKFLGDDHGRFAFALWAVRTFGGVIEHPEASHAWSWYGLARPPQSGGWIISDKWGVSCCVAQGHYGHRAQKLTWLYAVGTGTPELKWGRCPGMSKLDAGYHTSEERASKKNSLKDRLSTKENHATPKDFKELLINIVSGGIKDE